MNKGATQNANGEECNKCKLKMNNESKIDKREKISEFIFKLEFGVTCIWCSECLQFVL